MNKLPDFSNEYPKDFTASSREPDKRGEFEEAEVEEYKNEIANTIYFLKKYLDSLLEIRYSNNEAWKKCWQEHEKLRPILTELTQQILLAETGESGVGNDAGIAFNRLITKKEAADTNLTESK